MKLFGEAMSEWCDGLPRMFATSAEKGDGRKELLHFIDQAIS